MRNVPKEESVLFNFKIKILARAAAVLGFFARSKNKVNVVIKPADIAEIKHVYVRSSGHQFHNFGLENRHFPRVVVVV